MFKPSRFFKYLTKSFNILLVILFHTFESTFLVVLDFESSYTDIYIFLDKIKYGRSTENFKWYSCPKQQQNTWWAPMIIATAYAISINWNQVTKNENRHYNRHTAYSPQLYSTTCSICAEINNSDDTQRKQKDQQPFQYTSQSF